MEIYSLFTTFITVLSMFVWNEASFFANYTNLYVTGIVSAVAIWLVLFILQGVGLVKMAKGQRLKHKWLAFMPFANIFYIGKLAGECSLFGHKMKRAGLYTMIAQIVSTLVAFSLIAAELYLYIACSEYLVEETVTQGAYVYTETYFYGLTGFAQTAYKYYEYVSYFFIVFELIYKVLLLVLVMGLFRKYTPKSYLALSLVSLFVPEARFIMVLALSGRKPIDYEAYMRAKREEYARRQQEYYNTHHNPYGGNPYGGNPYGGNPYGGNPYNNPNSNPNPRPAPEDPFSEFNGKDKKNDDPFGGEFEDEKPKDDGDTDGFFD